MTDPALAPICSGVTTSITARSLLVTKNGGERIVDISVAPILDQIKRPTGTVIDA